MPHSGFRKGRVIQVAHTRAGGQEACAHCSRSTARLFSEPVALRRSLPRKGTSRFGRPIPEVGGQVVHVSQLLNGGDMNTKCPNSRTARTELVWNIALPLWSAHPIHPLHPSSVIRVGGWVDVANGEGLQRSGLHFVSASMPILKALILCRGCPGFVARQTILQLFSCPSAAEPQPNALRQSRLRIECAAAVAYSSTCYTRAARVRTLAAGRKLLRNMQKNKLNVCLDAQREALPCLCTTTAALTAQLRSEPSHNKCKAGSSVSTGGSGETWPETERGWWLHEGSCPRHSCLGGIGSWVDMRRTKKERTRWRLAEKTWGSCHGRGVMSMR